MVKKSDYKEIRIHKKHGGIRVLYEPAPWLKKKQKEINNKLKYYLKNLLLWRKLTTVNSDPLNLYELYKCIPNYLNSSIKKQLIGLNVHSMYMPTVLHVDIKNFFESINISNFVKEIEKSKFILKQSLFEDVIKYGFHPEGFLPQGAPSSSILADIAFMSIDKIFSNSEKFGIYYRYVDDLYFFFNSSDINVNGQLNIVYATLLNNGFFPNKYKSGNTNSILGLQFDGDYIYPYVNSAYINKIYRNKSIESLIGKLSWAIKNVKYNYSKSIIEDIINRKNISRFNEKIYLQIDYNSAIMLSELLKDDNIIKMMQINNITINRKEYIYKYSQSVDVIIPYYVINKNENNN